ncbi:MAG: triphosphoribosyl-dephospho-CoA synthase [Candidatus Geothermarchaeales archaeon]
MRASAAEIAEDVMRAAQLAASLEVSGWPKPGNVHRTRDFLDTRFEHYLAGSIAMGPAVREAALQGVRVAIGEIEASEIGVGRHVKRSVSDVRRWHGGGNTHLGVSLLFIPLAAAAGLTFASRGKVEPGPLRGSVRRVMESTQPQDAVDAYDAIVEASSAALGRLGDSEAPDLFDGDARVKILERGVSLYEAMRVASRWDNVAREWATGMEASFEVGYPTFRRVFDETRDVNIATVHAFLTILARHPDTFIARKVGAREAADVREAVRIGLGKSREVSGRAEEVLGLGGLLTEEGRRALFELDEDLRGPGHELNPGTTADLTASSLLVAVLCEFRP